VNILMVNPVHPATPHISATRAWRFSEELSRRGHRVVLLTASPPASVQEGPDDPDRDVRGHDMQRPLVVACGSAATNEAAPSAMPVLRRVTTATSMMLDGGQRKAWVARATRAAEGLPSDCRPDVIWCTVGMLESAFVAKRAATAFGCPWVLDVKDNCEAFVPRGLRSIMSWRLRGWAAVTANAQFSADLVQGWLGTAPSVIYSGVESDFFSPAETVDPPEGVVRLMLVGSTYFPHELLRCFEGIRMWFNRLPAEQQRRVVLQYIGGDGEAVASAASRLLPEACVEVLGYRPVAEMARACRSASVNMYIAHPAGFHHKLLELFACGRPVIAFPSEQAEATQLSQQTGARLRVAESPEVLADLLFTLPRTVDDRPGPSSADFESRWSWAAQAATLELVLRRVALGQ
jgi:glycosyltransferase involved in cell wall biosynthesis